MPAATFFVAIALCLTATTLAHAAGFRLIEVPAGADSPVLKGAMWYPCSEPPGAIQVGPFAQAGVQDCPVRGDKLPLVVVSHGRGGNFLSHYDLAERLADAGFVVAAITAPPRRDRRRRSGGIRRAADRQQAPDRFHARHIAGGIQDRSRRIGFFGFSFGGYTGLVLLGANPDWAVFTAECQRWQFPCEQVRRKEFRTQPLAHDARIKAAVIADPPAGFYFIADSFSGVKAPVQLWASEYGGGGVTPESVAVVDRSLTAVHEYHVVPNAAHSAFILCPPALAKAVPELCTDAPGFGRVAFHRQFNADVLAFFRAQLSDY
jgi:predicted dienelactone hydrolase